MFRLARMAAAAVFISIFVLIAGTRTPVAATGSPSGGQTGFLLGGTAQHALDSENPYNQVISIDTTAPIECPTTGVNCPSGTVSRRLDAKISQLDNMLEFKSYFQNRSCGGGSPRIQLLIDLNGDGTPDGNAFGYTAPPFNGCLPNRWQYDDVTDELPRWDVSQFVNSTTISGFPNPSTLCSGGPIIIAALASPSSIPGVQCPFDTNSGYIPWNIMEAIVTSVFPNHTVCSGALVDDSSWMPAAAGVAYYDLISLGKANWNNWSHTAGRGFARGCVDADHGDDHHDGDDNHDHKYDDGDRDWRERHHDH